VSVPLFFSRFLWVFTDRGLEPAVLFARPARFTNPPCLFGGGCH